MDEPLELKIILLLLVTATKTMEIMRVTPRIIIMITLIIKLTLMRGTILRPIIITHVEGIHL